jgi:hypothetical protein
MPAAIYLAMTARATAIISLFLVGHVTALLVAAIPHPTDVRSAAGQRQSPDDRVSATVRPLLDTAASRLEATSAALYTATAPIRPFVNRYVGPLGLAQTWNMFANPPLFTEYLRLRYYWTPAPGGKATPLMMATELVFPIAPERNVRLLRAFQESHRDKAISNAFSAYFRDRWRRQFAGDSLPSPDDPVLRDRLARSLDPVAEYFADRYADKFLLNGERLVRVEAWYGHSDSPQRGLERATPEAHRAVLARYYKEPQPEPVQYLPPTYFDRAERELDIAWTLIYVRKP